MLRLIPLHPGHAAKRRNFFPAIFAIRKNLTEAAKYLNFAGLSHEQRVDEGPRAAQQLGQLHLDPRSSV